MENIIKLEKINYNYYEKIPALKNISLEVKAGENLAIIGANGTGKSTLLQIMNGLLFPSSGKYFFHGYEITEKMLKDKGLLKYFRTKVGYLFQDPDPQLFCPTVLDELLYGPQQLEMDEEEAWQRAKEVMEFLGIEKLKDRPSYMLSSGEKKKVALASILTLNPEVLLLDEPTNGLDPRTQSFFVELMLTLQEAGRTIIVATHDLSLVDELQSSIVVLSEEHEIAKVGQAEAILADSDLLLEVNLIHAHKHLHGPLAHKHLHSHFSFHRH
ncbi:MAG: energy-coupling factor ABC transporter ATP-binding protein [Thermodesulfobacteriota bacterium]